MIRNEFEYKRTVARITEHHLQLVDQHEQLRLLGFSDEQIEQRIANLKSSWQHFEDEIATYERRTARTWRR